MNIKEAKEEIINTVKAYSLLDENGNVLIARNRQRPILIMGAPGLGKTAIMEQIADEMGIGLVTYNMTHHTRQSALGLPVVSEKTYGDKNVKVTEYTMSEIIASIYDEMEEKNIDRGILFLDEINCVSETMSPIVLQLLQNKMFGRISVPDGWVIVCAGNPEEYNKAVKEFDMVTLDRVRQIWVQPDYKIWREYAVNNGIDGSVNSYLNIKSENFYKAELNIDGMSFVTARGWEDLSDCIKAYTKLGIEVTEETVKEYITDDQIATDFCNFYLLYKRYEKIFDIEKMLSGEYVKDDYTNIPFDGKVSLIGIIISYLNKDFKESEKMTKVQDGLFKFINEAAEGVAVADMNPEDYFERIAYSIFKEWYSKSVNIEELKTEFFERNEEVESFNDELKDKLDKFYGFIEDVYGKAEEITLFTTELAAGRSGMYFITEHNYEKFFEYNRKLLNSDFNEELDIMSALTEE